MIKKEKILDFSEWVFIFDFDGTLVKTTEIGVQRIKSICQQIGLPSNKIPDNLMLRSFWGYPYTDLVIKISDSLSWSKQEVLDYWRADKTYLSPRAKRFTFVNSALEYLRDIGIKLALVSSRKREDIINVAEEAGLNVSFFAYIQGNECHDFTKPDPRVFDKIEEFFVSQGMSPDKFVYIGDTVICDLKAAQNRGYRFVATATSFVATPADFMSAGLNKNLIYTNPSELAIDVDKIIENFI